MAQGAAAPFRVKFNAPGNPQLPTLPNPADPKQGLNDLFVTGASINAPRYPEKYLEVLGAGPNTARGFAQTYLNQIGVTPDPIDYGNITAPKTRIATVHNTFRYPVTVSAVDVSGVSGVTLLSPGLPVVVPSFSSIVFTFEAALAGDVNFDGLAVFTTTEGPLTIRMIGRRIIIIAVAPQRAITEQLRFKTDNLITENGSEKAMSLRLAPRSSVNVELRYTNPLERAQLQNILLGAIHLPIGCQQWWQARELTSAALTTDDVIQVNTDDMEIEIGGTAHFMLRDRTSVEGEVLSFTSSTITLTQAIGTALPADTSCMMIKFGFLNPSVSIRDFPVNLQEINLSFELFDYANIGAIDPAYFDSHPVDSLPILKDCLFMDGRTRKGGITSSQGRLDGQTGGMTQSRTEVLSRPTQEVLAHINSLADQHAWRKFLHFIRGSWGKFYVPTGSNDLPLSAALTLGGNTFTVPQMGLASLVGNVAPRRDIRVTIAGVHYYRRITSVVDGGATETITMSSIIAGAGSVPIDEVNVCWLTLARLTSDTATFRHLYRGIAELRFGIRGVIDVL